VAEHTIALMLSRARFIPQASVATKAGKWEKKKFLGSELRGKVIGVIGSAASARGGEAARAFEMKVLAHDPYVQRSAKDLSIQLSAWKSCTRQRLHYVHVSLTPEPISCSTKKRSRRLKQGVRIVNCARGELLDEGR